MRPLRSPHRRSKASSSLAILAFASLSILSGKVPWWLIALIVVAGLLFEWLLATVRTANLPTAAAPPNPPDQL